MKVLFYLTIILIVLSPLTELLRFDLNKDVAIHIPDIVAGIVFLYWLLYLCWFNKFKKIYRKQTWNDSFIQRRIFPVFLFFLLGSISLLANSYWLKRDQLLVASLYLFRWIAYAGIFFVVS